MAWGWAALSAPIRQLPKAGAHAAVSHTGLRIFPLCHAVYHPLYAFIILPLFLLLSQISWTPVKSFANYFTDPEEEQQRSGP